MIKSFVASTVEVDDVDVAVEEILSQLDFDGKLLTNSVGIVSCHYEFVDSGVLKAISDALPFEVAGTISSPLSSGSQIDSLLFSVMVLSSDNVEFISALTPTLNEALDKTIADSYNAAAAKRSDKPGLILAFAPFMMQISGDVYADTLSEASGGVPVFGTLAVDDTLDFANCYMLYKGEFYTDKMSMILCYGDIKPRLYIANMSQDKMLERTAIITKSEGHIIKEINGKHAKDFFEEWGLVKAIESKYAMSALPFFLDYNDGTPKVSKTIIALTPEGYILCASAMPEGCSLQIGQFDKEDLLLTTRQAAEQIAKDAKDASAVLIYSCVGRCMALGSDQFREMELVSDILADSLPYMMMYSGGEICPTQVENGVATNRFHNNAFIACVF